MNRLRAKVFGTLASVLLLAFGLLLSAGTFDAAQASPSWHHRIGDHGNSDWSDSDSGGGHRVPEIDPGSAGLAIALVAGGLAILRDRRRRRG
ncbi:MAG: hypothetical protein D6815_10965 [Candidatus Dadabacteria bacterium]|nr:MAG: hypothetical protein D6815_10965 [Candidatus Dadabacteria bacterium]